jgi:hypothetical protein
MIIKVTNDKNTAVSDVYWLIKKRLVQLVTRYRFENAKVWNVIEP